MHNFIKKLNITLLVLSFIFVFSCSDKENHFLITGNLDNAAGKMLRIYEMATYDLVPADSVIVDENGDFAFEGKIDRIRFMSLRQSPASYLVLIVFPGDEIRITADIENFQETAEIDGSEESRLAAELNKKMHKTIMQLDSLGNIYRSKLNLPGTDLETLREDTREKFQAIAERQREFTIDFISDNTGSLASLMALYQQIDPETFVLGREEDFEYYILVDSVLFARYPDLDYTIALNENVREMTMTIERKRETERMLGTGVIAPEISLPDPDGELISLSSLRGNYVLLDFWAAWCGPCREENPFLAEMYNRYNRKGFEIYQVSLDRGRENWLRGIEEDNIDRWTQVSDLQFMGSPVVRLYNIGSIPANFLLDPDGRIIARDLRGAELERALAGIFD